MDTMLPNIALFAELGQWGDTQPTLLRGCSGVQSYQRAGTELFGGDDGGAAWLRCCRMSHYMRRRGKGGTLNPLCLVAASEYRAARELVESSWMATMGVLHGYYVPAYRSICRAGTMGRHSPHSIWWLPASIELPGSWWRARGWRRWGCCMDTMVPSIALYAETGQGGHTHLTLFGGC